MARVEVTLTIGSEEPVAVQVESSVELVDQPVFFSFDGKATWHAGEWVGAQGFERKAQVVVDETMISTPGKKTVHVRIEDTTTIIKRVGSIWVYA